MGNKVHKTHKSDQPEDNRHCDSDKHKTIPSDAKVKEHKHHIEINDQNKYNKKILKII